jgi:hypothetical protein
MEATARKPEPNRKRNVQMILRLTPDEKDFIMCKMKAVGYSNFSSFVRTILIRGEVKNVDLTHYRELAKEISRIGVNINQIVRFANANGNLYPQEIAELQQRMEDIWRLLKSNLSAQR